MGRLSGKVAMATGAVRAAEVGRHAIPALRTSIYLLYCPSDVFTWDPI